MMPEQIFLLLVFLLVILVNLITGFFRQRRARDAARERDPAGEKKEGPPARPPRPRVPPRIVVAPPRIDVSRPPRPVARSRRRGMRLQPADLRRAIVLVTLLGPPRAFDEELHDVKQ